MIAQFPLTQEMATRLMGKRLADKVRTESLDHELGTRYKDVWAVHPGLICRTCGWTGTHWGGCADQNALKPGMYGRVRVTEDQT